MGDPLASWRDGPTRSAIVEFVERVCRDDSPDFVAPDDRIAVFDNDGTLWCEKPMPIEIGFILRRLAEMADTDPALRTRQPWQAAHERDYGWLGDVITRHYEGDESGVKILLGGVLQAFAGWSVEEYATAAHDFLHEEAHPTLGRGYTECGYQPMIELLEFLEAQGFTNYIASGGDRDFMRPITRTMYGIPPERVIGSSNSLRYQPHPDGGSIVYLAESEVFDDGEVKPVRIWSRVGARPILAVGNSNGDVPMLEFCGAAHRPALQMLVLHDDGDREVAYTAGAETSLERARHDGWPVISMQADWTTVFNH
jgi:phosphoglycolate phosphatase-like HAD superfamily hydrolase